MEKKEREEVREREKEREKGKKRKERRENNDILEKCLARHWCFRNIFVK